MILDPRSQGSVSYSRGRLVSKLSTDGDPNPRWLVAFDEHSWTEEDMYESNFGEVLGKASEEVPKAKTRNTAPRASKDAKESSVTTASAKTENTTSIDQPKRKTRTGSAQEGISDSSTPTASDTRVTAREERVKRRQALTQDSGELVDAPNGKIGRPANKKKKLDDSDVVKIPMLTGTLYLYRGIPRRAEFVRKC